MRRFFVFWGKRAGVPHSHCAALSGLEAGARPECFWSGVVSGVAPGRRHVSLLKKRLLDGVAVCERKVGLSGSYSA